MEQTSIGRLEGKIDGLAVKIETVSVTLAGMMPRAEVDAEIGKRVSSDAYIADQRATNERLLRLEQSPMKLLAWIGAGVGCLSVTLSGVAIVVGIVEYIVFHH